MISPIEEFQGLTEAEARERLGKAGPNELPSSGSRGPWRVLISVATEPMILLLAFCAAVYLLLGDATESVLLMVSLLAVLGISFFQENKAERALEALKNLSAPRALVIRDARQRRIPGREVVVGDLAAVAEGDRIPADGMVLWGSNLSVDESLLTGESATVRKMTGRDGEPIGPPGGEASPFVYSGTLAVGGQALIRILATGAATEIGRIGKSMSSLDEERTPLQKETGRAVRIFASIGMAICAAIFVVYGATRSDWLRGALVGLTTAMSLLPEEFPVVLAIFLAMGGWRISKRRVLTRRIPALENLGTIRALCVDKTGTLTMNRMAVAALDAGGEIFEIGAPRAVPEEHHRILEYGVLASHRDPFDPMERAILDFTRASLSGTEHLHDDWELVREYPLKPDLLAMSCVWKSRRGGAHQIGTKGAPEAVMDLCRFDDTERRSWTERIQTLANRGLRVIAVAHATFEESDPFPAQQRDFDFEFIGLIGLMDPLRPGASEAVAECHRAGIRVLMITGDYPATARRIAADIGIHAEEGLLTGEELGRMDDRSLERRLLTTSVFARAVPEQKLRIVKALQANGQAVAMTGDGVNDGPALKAADIGIAMGARGTDVAREAADLVLLDDDFTSIVAAIRLGRRIYDNIAKAMSYLIAAHVPIAGMALLPVLFGQPLALLPVHVVFLELIIDPACSLVFEREPEEDDVMNRGPRPMAQRLFGRRMLTASLLKGLTATAAIFGLYSTAAIWGWSVGAARAQAFIALIFANLGFIFVHRSRPNRFAPLSPSSNPVAVWVAGGALFFLSLTLIVPFLRRLFGFELLAAQVHAMAALTGLGSVLLAQMVGSRLDRR